MGNFTNKMRVMQILQFEDDKLAHYAYAILSEGEMVLVDPARNPEPYYALARKHHATITAVVETHPHADFVSSHLEIHRTTGAGVYVTSLVGAFYPHHNFDEGDELAVRAGKIRAINTPGHSPDSISVILTDGSGKDIAVFTGDALLIGDCGRPDLREEAGNLQLKREQQAKQMHHTLQKYLKLDDTVKVYPAHGSGSLCGRVLSKEKSSTISQERLTNWCLQPMAEEDFVRALLAGQSFVPRYFPYDVQLNRQGAPDLAASLRNVPVESPVTAESAQRRLDAGVMIVDTRPQSSFKQAHLRGSMNLQIGPKFETWLGSVMDPGVAFYLAVAPGMEKEPLLERIAKIGYEPFIKAVFELEGGDQSIPQLDLASFKEHLDDFTLIDVRSVEESTANPFDKRLNIPLQELRERIDEIPLDKPLVVYCSSGYRSAAASSLIHDRLGARVPVYDLGESVTGFTSA